MSFIGFLALLVIDIGFLFFPLRQSLSDIQRKKKQIKTLEYASFAEAYSGVLTDEPEKDILLFEYHRTQDMLTHYDNLNWQIGSILVGSNIVALGFLSNSRNTQLLFAAAIGGSLSLFAWIFWYFRHASIYNIKNDRLYMIEQKLHMAQHRMVGYAETKKWLSRVSGRSVALMLCIGLLIAWLIVLI